MKLTVREYLLLGVIASVAIALRLYGLGLNGLWYDEIFSAEIARLPSLALIERTANDVHPPLYYLLLRAWNLLTGSESEARMRMLSVVFDVLGMFATAHLAWTIFKTRVAAWTALSIHALSPYAILYSQELRMYSLLLLVSAISISAMFGLADRATPGRVSVYWAATIASLYTHIFAVFLLLAQSLWFLTTKRTGGLTRGRWLVLQGTLGLAFSPWAWVITRQMLWAGGYRDRGEWWIPRPPLKALIGVIYSLLGSDWLLLGAGGALTALLLVRQYRRPLENRQNLLTACVLIVAVPISIAFIVSHITTPVFVSRFFTEVLPALWMLIVAGLLAFDRQAIRRASVALFLVLSARAIPQLNYDSSFKAPTPYREIVDYLANAPLGQVMVDQSPPTTFAWRWYTTKTPDLSTALKNPTTFDSKTTLPSIKQHNGPVYLVWTGSGQPPKQLPLEPIGTLELATLKPFRSFTIAEYRQPE